jgi:hypothetical protein
LAPSGAQNEGTAALPGGASDASQKPPHMFPKLPSGWAGLQYGSVLGTCADSIATQVPYADPEKCGWHRRFVPHT